MPKNFLRQLACTAAAVVLAAGSRQSGAAQGPVGDPFEFFAPWVAVSEADRRRLDRDEVVVRVLSGEDGQLAAFVATRLNAQPDALVAWIRAIAELKRSKFVLAVGRFSDPPQLSDLDDLILDERDLEAIRRCVPGGCGLKLSAPEIESLRHVVAVAGGEWQDAVRGEFRRLLIARVNLYRAGGLAALPPTADRRKAARLEDAFAAIVAGSPYLMRLPNVAEWLQAYPKADDPHVESFFYWSKEHYGDGKPVISVTHVGIVRPEPDRHRPAILVTGKQIFATHYIEGALGLTMVLRDAANGAPYLVYLNRTQVDLLRGFFGGLARGMLEGRLKRQAPQIVRGLRARLESGNPPDDPLDTLSQTTDGSANRRPLVRRGNDSDGKRGLTLE